MRWMEVLILPMLSTHKTLMKILMKILTWVVGISRTNLQSRWRLRWRTTPSSSQTFRRRSGKLKWKKSPINLRLTLTPLMAKSGVVILNKRKNMQKMLKILYLKSAGNLNACKMMPQSLLSVFHAKKESLQEASKA